MLTTKKNGKDYDIIINGSVLTTIKTNLPQEDLDKIYEVFVNQENTVKAMAIKETCLSIVGGINSGYLYK